MNESRNSRRDFIRFGAAVAGALGTLKSLNAQAPAAKGIPWWAAARRGERE